MSRSRRDALAALAVAPWLGCAGAGSERRPPRTPRSFSVTLPPIACGVLDGGPRLYRLEDHGLPLVALAVAVDAGHRYEQPGQEGQAALAGAMLLEGMEGAGRAALLDRYGELGTTPHVHVTPALLVLRCTVHRDDAPAALRLLLDNLRTASAADETFERVRREARESLLAARGIPESVAGFGLLLGSTGVEPAAALLSGGTPQSLASVELESVRAWIPARLRREGLTVLAAGDVDADGLRGWVGRALDSWSAPPGPPPPPSAPPPSGPKVVLVPWPRLPQSIVALGGPRSPYGDDDELAESLAESLIAGIVHHEFRERLRISYGVQTRSWATKRGPVAQLWSKVEPADVGQAVRRLRGYLARLGPATALSEEAVDDVRRSMMIGLMDGVHGPEPALGQLLRLAERGLPAEALQRRLGRLRSVEAAEVSSALHRRYHLDRARLCVVGGRAALERVRAELPADVEPVVRTPRALFGLPAGEGE